MFTPVSAREMVPHSPATGPFLFAASLPAASQRSSHFFISDRLPSVNERRHNYTKYDCRTLQPSIQSDLKRGEASEQSVLKCFIVTVVKYSALNNDVLNYRCLKCSIFN